MGQNRICLGPKLMSLSGLKDYLDQINGHLNHINTRRVDIIKYRRLSVDSNGSVQFTQMKLRNNNDVRTMFSISGQYSSKGSIELDNTFVKYFLDIQESFIRLGPTKKSRFAWITRWRFKLCWSIIFCVFYYVVEIDMFNVSCCCCRIWLFANFFEICVMDTG